MSELRDWPNSIPLVLTLENDWLRHDYEGDSQGQAFWVDCAEARAFVALMRERESLSVNDACYEWARKAGRETGLNALLARPLGWEWRVKGRGSTEIAVAALRCFSEKPLSAEGVLSRLGLRSLGELPCAGDKFSFVGSNLEGWLEAIGCIRESQELAGAAAIGQKIKLRRL